MKLGETRKTVVFNLDQPEQRELFKLAGTLNFSSWVREKLLVELRKQARQDKSQITIKVEG